MLNRENYENFSHYIKKDILAEEERTLLYDFGEYFRTHEEVSVVDVDDFMTWFTCCKHTEYSSELYDTYKLLMSRIKKCESQVLGDVLDYFNKEYYKEKLTDSLEKNFDPEYINQMCDEYSKSRGGSDIDTWEETWDYDEIFDKNVVEGRLAWSLDCLNNCVGKLKKGMFGIIAAYVGTGKTSFCISQAVHMVKQLRPDECILWFNNEGDMDVLKRRMDANLLELPVVSIIKNKDKYKEVLEKKKKNIGDIKVFNTIGKSLRDIERAIKVRKPALIIIDQLDNLLTTSEVDHNKLKQLYQRARELAIKYAPVLAVSQCSADVAYTPKGGTEVVFKKKPHMSQLEGSKVGKASAADFVITLAPDNEGESLRKIHVSKNKSEINEGSQLLERTLLFDGKTGKYSE
jgi:KaiC/GvpD/RAD55 family RecA-like ATPase